MNVNSKIITTLQPFMPRTDTTKPNIVNTIYEGKDDKYITFNYADDRGEIFADDKPIEDAAALQIHLHCPGQFNYMTLKQQIRKALHDAGFSYPEVIVIYETETDTNHIIFECEIIGKTEA